MTETQEFIELKGKIKSLEEKRTFILGTIDPLKKEIDLMGDVPAPNVDEVKAEAVSIYSALEELEKKLQLLGVS